jgi:hypothetical protein
LYYRTINVRSAEGVSGNILNLRAINRGADVGDSAFGVLAWWHAECNKPIGFSRSKLSQTGGGAQFGLHKAPPVVFTEILAILFYIGRWWDSTP